MFITIQEWMRTELNLKSNKLLIFALINGFSQKGQGEFYGSLRYIENATGISIMTIRKVLKELEEENLIKKTSESHYKVLVYSNNGKVEKVTGGEYKEPKPEVKKEVATIEVPQNINKEAWSDWEQYRKEIKKKISQTTAKKQFAFLQKYNFEEQRQIIDSSIQNSWQGLFEPKKNRYPTKKRITYFDA